jgi:streptogramin lyase
LRYLTVFGLLAAFLTGCSSHAAPTPGSIAAASQVVQKQPLPAPGWTWVNVPFVHGKAADVVGLASDGKSKMWFIDEAKQFGSVSMTQQLRTYPLNIIPVGVTVGPDGNLWITGTRASPEAGVVAKVTPSGSETDFIIPGSGGLDQSGIVTGPDGALWFTVSGPSARGIGRITTAGSQTFYSFPNTDPFSIAVGSDGNLWAADYFGALDKVTTAGEETVYPTVDSPFIISPGPDGALYFSAHNGTFGRMTTGGQVSYFGQPVLDDMANGPDKVLWAGDLVTFNPATSTFTQVSEYPHGSNVNVLAIGPDRNIWVAAGESIGTYVRLAMTVTPSSLTIGAPGDTGDLTTTETSYYGAWSGSTSAKSIATVVQASSGSFTVTGVAVGACKITIKDTTGNSVVVPVTVN